MIPVADRLRISYRTMTFSLRLVTSIQSGMRILRTRHVAASGSATFAVFRSSKAASAIQNL